MTFVSDASIRVFYPCCSKYTTLLFLLLTFSPQNVAAHVQGVIISCRNHDDLGTASAAAVESYFSGAVQLECTINGSGERSGNTNFAEAACALHNSGGTVTINFQEIYQTSKLVSRLSSIPIHEKSPLVGSDVYSHRSGIHQDGAMKTAHLQKGGYRAIDPSFIGRDHKENICFTNQSGRNAIADILQKTGIRISLQEAR